VPTFETRKIGVRLPGLGPNIIAVCISFGEAT
jgi:hypothetical protein